jgi:GT2 family glycosyltransferase
MVISKVQSGGTRKTRAHDPVHAPFEGYVEVYGYHSLAAGWFFAGWMTDLPDIYVHLRTITAEFAGAALSGDIAAFCFPRDDLAGRGIGFLLFLPAKSRTAAAFQRLSLTLDGEALSVVPVVDVRDLPENKLVPQIDFLLDPCEASPERAAIEQLLTGAADSAGRGYVEYFGYHAGAGGWFLSGWVSHGWAQELPERLSIVFEEGDVRGELVCVLYARAELPAGAQGAVFFVRAPFAPLGPLVSLNMLAGGVRLLLQPLGGLQQLREAELTTRVKTNLAQAHPGLPREQLGNLLARRPFIGENSLDALSPHVFMHIDDAIRCGPDGLVLMGWLLSKPGYIQTIRLHCDAQVLSLRPEDVIKIDRPDVLAGYARYGFDDVACGFVAFLPVSVEPHARLYLEVETPRLEVGYLPVAHPARAGMEAIKHLMGAVDKRFDDMRDAFDHVLGRAMEALNRERLAIPPGVQPVAYGTPPPAPKFSVIVPLYGRLDFVEYQLALFSARPEAAEVEFIYVLDDPPKRREAQRLFTSIYERFLIPFRVILLDRNLGFAPACNIGLAHARGAYVAYLNSDVFPGTQDWLERLAARLEADPAIGVIGPLLLFEDGSVQHRGMYFERLAEFGGWFFCQHRGKGLRYAGSDDLQRFISITGACMVMRRALASQLGGFDESYAIGDFEDSDMCLKLQALGYECVVDPDVRLYHLERKSQLSAALNWRMNLTAFNAWQHDRRWSATIAQLQSPADEGRFSK